MEDGEERPAQREGLEVVETEDGLIVYQEATDRVHHLNPAAAVILQLCDGTRTLNDIATGLAEVFSLAEPPTAVTLECIADLRRKQLI
jgi:hypothetical protein